jgi:transcriptional regulator with XRE-family HTH domain
MRIGNIFLSVKHLTLKRARIAKGLTQEELAAVSGVQQSAISKLERGDVSDPQKSTADALEDALGLQRGTLIFGPAAVAS